MLPHPAALPANVSHMNQSKTNNDCPAWFILRSSNPNPKGSVEFEFRDELRGGRAESRNPVDFEFPGTEE